MADGVAVWVLVVPVKRLAAAKSRLGPPYDRHRRDLALAFALDTVQAALMTTRVRAVMAVTDEPEAARALTAIGALVVGDEPDAGLNPALRHGGDLAARRHPGCGTGALSADLPALRPTELDAVLAAASGLRRSFVRDAAGTGTTLVLARPGEILQPTFGNESARRHLDVGHHEITGDDLRSVRQDVDTATDLADAVALGVGAHTRAVLDRLAPASAE